MMKSKDKAAGSRFGDGFRHLVKKVSGALQWFYAPVGRNPLLFALVALCSAASPLAALVAGARCMHFLLHALLGGCLWACLACRLPKTWLKVTVACLFMCVALAEVFHMALLYKSLDQDSIALVMNTGVGEARGFIVEFLSPQIIIALVLAVAALVLLSFFVGRSRLTLPRWCYRFAFPLFLCVCAGAAGVVKMFSVLTCSTYEELIVWESVCGDNPDISNGARALKADPVSKSAYLFRAGQLYARNFHLWSDCQRKIYDAVPRASAPGDSLSVVVVIGESFIRSHSSLYGYHLPVNPGLEREMRDSALFVFADAVAPANYTVISLSNILNLNALSRSEKWWESVSLPMAFHKAGWSVEMFSNQYVPRSNQDLGMELFDTLALDSIYSAYNSLNFEYDGDFLASLPLRQGEPEARTLTVIHLMGQHFPPSMRVPPASRHRFVADDIPADKPWLTHERRVVVAEYADATLYNDSIVSAIIDTYRDKPTLLVYFSDHGEEMWDSAPAGHRTRQYPDDHEWVRRMHDVPLVFWMSPSLRRQSPQLEAALRSAVARPVSLDLIAHSLLGAFVPSSPWYRQEFDVLSPAYVFPERILAHGYYYSER